MLKTQKQNHYVKQCLKMLLLLPVIIVISGCISHYGAAYIQSEPSGVQVFDMEDGSYIGVTPVQHVWRSRDAKSKFMNIRLHQSGFEDAVNSFWLNLKYYSAKSAAENPQPVKLQLKELN